MGFERISAYAGLEARHSLFGVIYWAAAVVFVCSVTVWPTLVGAESMQDEIDSLEDALVKARGYLGNYPGGNNDPNPVRRRFLGVDDNDRSAGDQSPAHALGIVVDNLVRLSRLAREPHDRERIDALLHQATQIALQGWIISGNISLMEGLRVSYPVTTGSQSRPRSNPVPYGSLENELDFISVKDATRAMLFYDEATRVLLTSLRRRRGSDRGRVIIDVDTQRIPSDKRGLPGAFDNHRFPQYTWYLDSGNANDTSDDRIVPIQTQGHLMGNLLHKHGQAVQSIGYRLWTAAYFSRQAQDDMNLRKQLLDAAVAELHAGANTQFLNSIALAATVGDKAETTAQTPYEVDQLYHARNNVKQARDTIRQIRANEKPALPIDEIMAGDMQVNSLLDTLNHADGPGSFARAEKSYEAAKKALFRVQQVAEKTFREEGTRQQRFFERLEELTGEPVSKSIHEGITPETLRTAAGQADYMDLIRKRINRLMETSEQDFGDIQNRLDDAVKQVRFQRQEVHNKKAALDSYPQRIKIIEDTLGTNKSAIKWAEGRITAKQLSMGMANSVSLTATAGVGSRGPFSSVSATFHPGAILAADLQSDITREHNLKEIKFLQGNAGARIRNLLLDQDLILGELKSQLTLLRHAEDAVNKILGDTQRILAQLRTYDRDVAKLWYNDPVWNIELTGTEEEANRDMAALVANLYKLGRLLEIRWVEPFANPVSVTNRESVSLGSDFEKFWGLESVFALPLVNVRDNPALNSPPEQARNFYAALKEWDKTLRQQRNFEGDLPPFEISLRQDVFGLADVKTVDGQVRSINRSPINNPDHEKDEAIRRHNIRRFQNILINHGLCKSGDHTVTCESGNKPRGFLVSFPLRYHTNGFANFKLGNTRLFGTVNAWNYRLAAFKLRIAALEGRDAFDGGSQPIYILAQAGSIENIGFLERRLRTYNLDNYARYDTADLGASGNSPYLLYSFVRKKTYPSNDEVRKATAMSGRFWSPFASRWLLQFDPTNTFEIENIEDIWIQMTLTAGQPSCPMRWREHCG